MCKIYVHIYKKYIYIHTQNITYMKHKYNIYNKVYETYKI